MNKTGFGGGMAAATGHMLGGEPPSHNWISDVTSEKPNSESTGRLALETVATACFALQEAAHETYSATLYAHAAIMDELDWCLVHCLIHAGIKNFAGARLSVAISILWECLESKILPLPMSEHVFDFLYCDRMGDLAPPGFELDWCLMASGKNPRKVRAMAALGLLRVNIMKGNK